jgi:hypothetical protein
MDKRKIVLKLVRDLKVVFRSNYALLQILQRSSIICLNIRLLRIKYMILGSFAKL